MNGLPRVATDCSLAIDPGISSYLDLFRTLAAVVVVLSHLVPNLFGIDVIPGHDAVIVFFVISGYVIAFAAENRDRTIDHFVVNRLARLWSVLLPSVLISAIAAITVGKDSGIIYAPAITDPGAFATAALLNAAFLGQNWFLPAPMPFSDPAWSLSYEAWYYAIYASFIFAPVRWRWHAAAVCVLLAGPPIVALMPCWLLGTWLYKRRTSLVLPPTLAYALFAACIALYAAVYTIDLGGQARVWLSDMTGNHSFRLRASTKFATDFLDACLFAGTIVAVGSMPAINRALAAARSAFRAISSKTFSLYLYHMPVFVILYGGLHIGRGSNTGATICIVSVVLVCALLGTVTEAKLAPWRRGVRRMTDLITAGAAAINGGRNAASSRVV